MKKRGLVLAIVALALIPLLSGCGSKKVLSCTTTEGNNKGTINLTFSGKVLKEANAEYSFDISGYTSEQKETIKALNLCDSFKENAVFGTGSIKDCKQNTTGDNIYVKAELDTTKIVEEETEDYTVESIKADLESSGMTCTIK